MNMKLSKKILLLTASVMLFLNASAHNEHDAGFKEEIINENGGKVVVKTIHINVDFQKKYEELKAKWDKRQESWDAREQQHNEAMKKLNERLEVDSEEYQKIRELLGTRLWTQRSIEYL